MTTTTYNGDVTTLESLLDDQYTITEEYVNSSIQLHNELLQNITAKSRNNDTSTLATNNPIQPMMSGVASSRKVAWELVQQQHIKRVSLQQSIRLIERRINDMELESIDSQRVSSSLHKSVFRTSSATDGTDLLREHIKLTERVLATIYQNTPGARFHPNSGLCIQPDPQSDGVIDFSLVALATLRASIRKVLERGR